jgi:hypothetical protein
MQLIKPKCAYQLRNSGLAAEKARYGGQTRGGVGISIPLGVSV